MPPLIALLLTIALVGFLVWVLVTYVPMPEAFRRLLIVVAVLLLLLYLARFLGLL